MKKEEMGTWKLFMEDMEAKAELCLPAAYTTGCMEGKYALEIKEAPDGYRMWLSDGQSRVLEMPYLDLAYVYEMCGGRFDTDKIRKCLGDYICQYERAVTEEAEEQQKFRDLLKNFPEKQMVTMLVPDSEKARENIPGRIYQNVRQIYAILIPKGTDKSTKIKTSVVTLELMEKWSVCENDLFEASVKYMPLCFPYEIQRLRIFPDVEAYVIGTDKNCFGTGTLFYQEGPLKELAMEYSSDLQMFPLSVHEVAVFPEIGYLQKEDLEEIAQKISPFGKELWRYNRVLKQIAFSKQEQEVQKIQLKDGIADAAEREKLYAAFR